MPVNVCRLLCLRVQLKSSRYKKFITPSTKYLGLPK